MTNEEIVEELAAADYIQYLQSIGIDTTDFEGE